MKSINCYLRTFSLVALTMSHYFSSLGVAEITIPAPSISEIVLPENGAASRDYIVVKGKNFYSSTDPKVLVNKVSLGGQTATTRGLSEQYFEFQVPSNLRGGSHRLIVQNGYGKTESLVSIVGPQAFWYVDGGFKAGNVSGFGETVLAADRFVFVGAPGRAVYVYEKPDNKWRLTAAIVDPMPKLNSEKELGMSNNGFAKALAFSDGRLIIGAPEKNYTGMVFVFRQDESGQWKLEKSLQPTDKKRDWLGFGNYVSVSKEFLVVGGNREVGVTVYNLVENNWGTEPVWTSFSRPPGPVSLKGNKLLINEYAGYDPLGFWISNISLFKRLALEDASTGEVTMNWTSSSQVAERIDGVFNVAKTGFYFKNPIVLADDSVAVTWPHSKSDDRVPLATGMNIGIFPLKGDKTPTYLYPYWGTDFKPTAGEASPVIDYSGTTLAIAVKEDASKTTGIVLGDGQPADRDSSNNGAVHVMVKQGSKWIKEAYIKRPTAMSDGFFGQSVSLSGDTLVVGAPGKESRSVYVYKRKLLAPMKP